MTRIPGETLSIDIDFDPASPIEKTPRQKRFLIGGLFTAFLGFFILPIISWSLWHGQCPCHFFGMIFMGLIIAFLSLMGFAIFFRTFYSLTKDQSLLPYLVMVAIPVLSGYFLYWMKKDSFSESILDFCWPFFIFYLLGALLSILLGKLALLRRKGLSGPET